MDIFSSMPIKRYSTRGEAADVRIVFEDSCTNCRWGDQNSRLKLVENLTWNGRKAEGVAEVWAARCDLNLEIGHEIECLIRESIVDHNLRDSAHSLIKLFGLNECTVTDFRYSSVTALSNVVRQSWYHEKRAYRDMLKSLPSSPYYQRLICWVLSPISCYLKYSSIIKDGKNVPKIFRVIL